LELESPGFHTPRHCQGLLPFFWSTNRPCLGEILFIWEMISPPKNPRVPTLDLDPTTNDELHLNIWEKLKEKIETQMKK
jgi:predicted small integral membrane protein